MQGAASRRPCATWAPSSWVRGPPLPAEPARSLHLRPWPASDRQRARASGGQTLCVLPALRAAGAARAGKVDFAGDYQLRREVAAKVTGLTEYNMTFISTASDPEHLVFPACDVEACWSLPRCAVPPCMRCLLLRSMR